MEKVVTYSLLKNQSNSDQFYTELSTFTDTILDEGYADLGSYVDKYFTYLKNSNLESVCTENEYLLELIMTGIFWKNYIHKADKTKYLSKVVLTRLYKMRKNKALKTAVDNIRGYLAYELLTKQKDNIIEKFTIDAYCNLLKWLTATREFNEEIVRLSQWTGFYKTKDKEEIENILKAAASFASKFNLLGKSMLGKYTTHVTEFLRNEQLYVHREDYFFTRRPEIEYFMNMFGAEVMNRQLRANFERTERKAALFPTCMRSQPKNGCKAKSDGKELICNQCNEDCNIGKVAKVLKEQNVTSYLIPHSSEFSKFLVKWKDEKEIGLIGVACVLNLLTGGYEMKRLEIASQCIFLDYCGCKKHWDNDGFATNLNVGKLKQIVSSSQSEPRNTIIS